jgi:hypothetical protein
MAVSREGRWIGVGVRESAGRAYGGTRSCVTFVAFTVTSLAAQSPKFVPGEVLTRFVPGSEQSAVVQRAAGTQPIDLSKLVPIANDLGRSVGVPLRPARVTSGDFCVLAVDAEQVVEHLRRRLSARRNVRHVQAEAAPSPVRLLLDFTPASDEFTVLSATPGDGRLAGLVASLERDVGVPLKAQVVESSRLALQVDLEALTLRLVERLKAQPILESVQPNYVLEGFIRR